MKVVTVEIYSDTKKGMNLLNILKDMAQTGKDIKFKEPGNELDEYKKMQNPTTKKTVIITDTTERAKGIIGLLDELNPGVGFYHITENERSTQDQVKEYFDNNGMFDK